MTRFTVRFVALLCIFFAASGCNVIGAVWNPGAFEKKVPPAFDLKDRQERKVLIWIECPRSANADFDLQGKLEAAFQLYSVEKAGFESENILLSSVADSGSFLLDPKAIARSQDAGYLLLVQVDRYEADFLQIRDYYAGELISRAVLYDVDLDQTLWPSQPEGKMTHVAAEMEVGGRDALVSRLTSATAHCILRNLYPCDKLKYKTRDERVSLQEAYEMETY